MRPRGISSAGPELPLVASRTIHEDEPATPASRAAMHAIRTPADPRTALLDRMSTFVLTVDSVGNIAYANAAAARALGAEAESPVGLPISLIAPEMVGTSWSAFLATLRASGVITTDTRLRTLDGGDVAAE